MHVAYVTALCLLVGVELRKSKPNDKNKDAPGAEDAGDFWTGMLLSLNETTARRYKTRKAKYSEGLTAGMALMARGWIIENLGDPALAHNHRWFGNNKSEEDKKKDPTHFEFAKVC